MAGPRATVWVRARGRTRVRVRGRVSKPASILQTVGGELASSAVFFMTYLMILEGFGLPFKEPP